MSYAKEEYNRSHLEIIFILLFIPATIFGYSIYKFPEWFIQLNIIDNQRSLYLLGKHPTFWYITLYSFIVCCLAIKVLWQARSPYKKNKKSTLSSYQRNKFISILIVQGFFLWLLPFVLIPIFQGKFWGPDPSTVVSRDAFVYVSKGFKSIEGLLYTFIIVPISVWFFGKRFCSWYCACGNLAETVGITKWGRAWVKYKTPTGKLAKKLENLQTIFLIFGLGYGLLIFFDTFKIATASGLLEASKFFQDLVVDLVFGSLIGIGAYPFLGTRVWCRYGCPLAKGMELFGRYVYSDFKVSANDNCKGLNLCSQVCPMGIDVASYAHKDKIPIQESFGLYNTTCIGCGGCVDVCPVDALSFQYPKWFEKLIK